MSCYRSGYLAILDLTGIILCHNTMGIMTVIIKIRNNIQILYHSCILLDQRLLETGYCETGSVQRPTEIRCRKICPSVCTDIFCQTIVCSLVRLDQIKIIDLFIFFFSSSNCSWASPVTSRIPTNSAYNSYRPLWILRISHWFLQKWPIDSSHNYSRILRF